MTAGQKMKLAFRSSTDPVAFAAAFVVAGYREALDDDPGFGWGAEGYGKRSGAAYLDAFDGGIIGNGILPSILHQDPRYFRLGHGTTTHRLLYALATNVICKHDNTHKWEPNYSNVGGNIIAARSPISTIRPANPASVRPSATGSLSPPRAHWLRLPGVLARHLAEVSPPGPHSRLDAQARAADKANQQAPPNAK